MDRGGATGPLQQLEQAELDADMRDLNISVSINSSDPLVISPLQSTASDAAIATVSPSKTIHVHKDKNSPYSRAPANTNGPINASDSTTDSPLRIHKRLRNTSSASSNSDDSISSKHVTKMARTNSPVKIVKHVNFSLQNNNDNTNEGQTAAANNDGNANRPPLSSYQVNPMALPMWRSARNNLIAANKARLRADNLQALLESDTVPACFYGADKLPASCHSLRIWPNSSKIRV
jgi:hypothetical protein